MLTDFIFDADDPEAFVKVWNNNVGLLYKEQEYNGWAFFNSDAKLLDVRIADVDNKWVDMGFDASSSPNKGWDWLVATAKELGATDVIGVHNHPPEAPLGPCSMLMRYVGAAVPFCADNDIDCHGVVVLNGGELDGIMWAEIATDDDKAQMIDPVQESIDFLLNDGKEIMAMMQEQAAKGDPNAEAFIPVIGNIISELEAGRKPSKALLDEAMVIVMRGLLGIAPDDVPSPKRRQSVLDLPIFDANQNKGLLN